MRLCSAKKKIWCKLKWAVDPVQDSKPPISINFPSAFTYIHTLCHTCVFSSAGLGGVVPGKCPPSTRPQQLRNSCSCATAAAMTLAKVDQNYSSATALTLAIVGHSCSSATASCHMLRTHCPCGQPRMPRLGAVPLIRMTRTPWHTPPRVRRPTVHTYLRLRLRRGSSLMAPLYPLALSVCMPRVQQHHHHHCSTA